MTVIMEIVIGRNPQDNRMMLTVDGKDHPTQILAPIDVSPKHCILTLNNGQIRLKNLDVNNYTYVNGQIVETKHISQSDKIELGKGHFSLGWSLLEPFMPMDISHLKNVWEDYENGNVSLLIKERKFNAIRSATGIFTMVAIALSIATGGRSKWYFVLYGVAILASVIFFIKAYIDSSKIPQKRLELTRQFQRDYVCPKCKHSMGNQPYEFLAQNAHCPYCKTEFIH